MVELLEILMTVNMSLRDPSAQGWSRNLPWTYQKGGHTAEVNSAMEVLESARRVGVEMVIDVGMIHLDDCMACWKGLRRR